MRSLTDRERKLVALLILVLFIAMAIFFVVSPIASGFSERAAQRAALADRHVLNQRLISAIPRLRRAAEVSDQAVRAVVIKGVNRELAAQQLQDRVSEAVERTGGELRAVEDTSDDGSLRIRTSAVLTLPQFLALNSALQNVQPYAMIETLSLSADQALISGRPDIMDMTFDVVVPYAPHR
jgi:hypothetical protein